MIIIALSVYKFAQGRQYGLISLISWHFLVIFFIPLFVKIFEFLQIDAIFQFIFDVISSLFGGLLFLINYVYILLIPLVRFGIIKFFQKFVFNAKVQAANRVEKSLCLNSAKKFDVTIPTVPTAVIINIWNLKTVIILPINICRTVNSVELFKIIVKVLTSGR